MADSWLGSTAANAAGGLVTSFIVGSFAYWRARVPNISGVWKMTVDVQRSDYNPYVGMRLTYILMLSQGSGVVQGVAEKVHEVSKINPSPGLHYQKSGRMHSEIDGGIYGNIFQRKEFNLVMRESGHRRNFISTVSLRVGNDNALRGAYISTAANSSGRVVLTRGIGIYGFSQ